MRMAVTGGAGFIGGVVVRQLVARGDEVVALVRDPNAPGATAIAGPGVTLATSDLSDIGSAERRARRR